MSNVEISCPKCNWHPDGYAYWACSQCGHGWNTFDTRGQCPKCKHQHHLTQCIAFAGGCNGMSPHLKWYKGLDESINVLKELVKEVKVEAL